MKKATILLLVLVLLASGFYAYRYLTPYRDTVETSADIELTLSEFVAEYLNDATTANAKYLANDGGSLILALEGKVKKTSTSFDGRAIVILSAEDALANVQCLFAEGVKTPDLTPGSEITIKGVLRAGPGYDADLEMYENGYLEECSLIQDRRK